MSRTKAIARGDIWAFDVGGRGDPMPLAVVQADVLNGAAPTVVGVVVTSRPQRAGEPLVVGVEPGTAGLTAPAWLKVTQVHTLPAADAGRRLGTLPPATLERLDDALAAVLGLAG